MCSLEPHLRVRTFAMASHSQSIDSAHTIWTEWMIQYYGEFYLSATSSTQTTCAGDWAVTTYASPTSRLLQWVKGSTDTIPEDYQRSLPSDRSFLHIARRILNSAAFFSLL